MITTNQPRTLERAGSDWAGGKAFSRLDLLAAIAMVILLALVQLKGIAGSRLHGQLGVCLNNKERLTLAWRLYAEDNNGRLVGNLDGGGTQMLANSNLTWVLGWLDQSGSPDNTNTLFLTRYSPLAPYADRAPEPFRCPADQSLNRGTRGEARVRSVSMNGYLGVRAAPYTAGYQQFIQSSELRQPPPSQLFVFIDEREESINDGWFIVNMSGYSPPSPSQLTIVDYPGADHEQGAGFGFADGHAELKRWTDGRTVPVWKSGQPILNVASPNNRDLMWLQARSSSRVNTR